MKNKFKIIATATAIAAVATPMITLASCNHISPVVIDEAEKTKALESGSRSVTYTFTLASPYIEGEQITVELTNIASTAEGFTVQAAEPVCEAGKSEVQVTVNMVQESQDAILPANTEITFDSIITRKDSSGKELSKTEIKGFKMHYETPETSDLELVGSKTALSNPGEAEHVFEFNVGSTITLEETDTIECDVVRTGGTENVNAAYVETVRDIPNKKLFVKIKLDKASALAVGDKVDFDFTLSCSKGDKEAWRQTTSGCTITYLQHYMYIFDDYQWSQTMAGDKTFNLYIAKHPSLHWGQTPYEPSLQISDVKIGGTASSAGMTVGSTVKEYKSQKYEYFIVPITINETTIADNAEITYTATLKGKPSATEETIGVPFTGRKIKYITEKVTQPAEALRKPTEILTSDASGLTHKYEMTLPASTNAPASVTAYVSPTSVESGVTVTAGEVEVASNKITVPVTITTTDTQYTIPKFNFILFGEDASGEVIWTQKVNDFSLTYIDPVKVASKNIETALDGETGTPSSATGEFTFTTPSALSNLTITGATPKNVVKDATITDLSVDPTITGNKIKTIMTGSLGFKSAAKFDLEINGTYTVGATVTPIAKTISGCTFTYNGTVARLTNFEQHTDPGKSTFIHKFRTKSPNEVKVTLTQLSGGSAGRVATLGVVETTTEGLINVPVSITSDSVRSNPIQDNDRVHFSLTFSGTSPLGTPWTKTIGDTTAPFILHYTASAKANVMNVKTVANTNKATINISSKVDLIKGDYYAIEIWNQEKAHGIIVDTPYVAIKPTSRNWSFDITLNKTGALVAGESTHFNAKLYTFREDKELRRCEELGRFSVTYNDSWITWNEEDWYFYEKDSATGYGTGKVRFNLAEEKAAGQTITAQVVSGTTTGNTLAIVGDPTISGKVATVNMTMEPASGILQYCTSGTCSIKFTCTQAGTEVWTQTITNFKQYFLSPFVPVNIEETTLSNEESATFAFNLNADTPTDIDLMIKATATTLEGTRGLEVYADTISWVDTGTRNKFNLPIWFHGTTARGDKVKFQLTFDIYVKDSGGQVIATTTQTLSQTFTLIKG